MPALPQIVVRLLSHEAERDIKALAERRGITVSELVIDALTQVHPLLFTDRISVEQAKASADHRARRAPAGN